MRVREDYRTLTGPEKAAILMLSVGEEHASRLFALMDDEEIRELSQTMSNLGTVHASIIERLSVEFADQIPSTGSLVGAFDSTEHLLEKVLGRDRVDGVMEEIRGDELASRLKNESPQTIAVVLAKIKPEHGARVLSHLPEALAQEVLMRMLRTESVQKEVLDDLERPRRSEFMNNLAHITESRFISGVEERSRDSAGRLKAMMFTFEDLGRLDPGSVQTLLRNVDRSKLAIALKGASEPLRDLFFANMSERARKLLREEIQALGPVKLRDVDEAQMYMVGMAKELAAKDELVIAGKRGGDDELIY
jgi:flagellar motor switch protein FliG